MTTNHPAPHTATRLARLTRRSALLWVLTISAFAISCAEEKGKHAPAIDEKDSVPFMQSWGISTLISDSGVTRYRIQAKEWRVFDKADEPYWYFPQGIFVEKFDSSFNTESFILSDTAIFYNKLQLWRLRGDVRIENMQDERFFTEEIYWNQQKKSIYSDSAIHIERSDRIIEGIGFVSNEAMTQYTIRHTTGIFPINQNRNEEESSHKNSPSRNPKNNAQKYAPKK